jgi:hypothetical protein
MGHLLDDFRRDYITQMYLMLTLPKKILWSQVQ